MKRYPWTIAFVLLLAGASAAPGQTPGEPLFSDRTGEAGITAAAPRHRAFTDAMRSSVVPL